MKLSLPVAASSCILALYSLGLLDHDLWTPDEPRVAAIGRAAAEGAWIVPALNGRPFLEVPPLHAWCMGAVYRLLGPDSAASPRVLSALFGLGGIVVTGLLAGHLAGRGGDRARGRRVGLLAATCLAISAEYLHTAHRVVPDGLLVLLTTASAYALLRGVDGTTGPGATLWLAGGYALASLAFLAKGSIGLAVPGLALISVSATRREAGALLRARLWLAPIIFAGVAGPWLWLLHDRLGWAGVEEVVITNTLGRVLSAVPGSRGHERPLWFYAIYLPVHLLPAALFTAGGILRRVRERRELDPREHFGYDFALAWLGSGFLILSLASTKRAVYLVPFFPAAAVAAGFWLEQFISMRAGGAFARWMERLLAASLLGCGAAVPAAAVALEGGSLPWAALGAAAGAAGFIFILRAARRGEREDVFKGWLVALTIVVAGADLALVPAIDRIKSLGPAARGVARLVPADRAISALDPDETTRAMIPLYTGRPLEEIATVEDLRSRLEARGELYLFTVDKHGRSPSTIEKLGPVRQEKLFEDAREGSRALRLYRLEGW